MVNSLIQTILTGLAVAFLLEVVDKIQRDFFDKSTINFVFSSPLSLGGIYLFTGWTKEMFVLVPATTFIALMLNLVVNRPYVIKQDRLPRIR